MCALRPSMVAYSSARARLRRAPRRRSPRGCQQPPRRDRKAPTRELRATLAAAAPCRAETRSWRAPPGNRRSCATEGRPAPRHYYLRSRPGDAPLDARDEGLDLRPVGDTYVERGPGLVRHDRLSREATRSEPVQVDGGLVHERLQYRAAFPGHCMPARQPPRDVRPGRSPAPARRAAARLRREPSRPGARG